MGRLKRLQNALGYLKRIVQVQDPVTKSRRQRCAVNERSDEIDLTFVTPERQDGRFRPSFDLPERLNLFCQAGQKTVGVDRRRTGPYDHRFVGPFVLAQPCLATLVLTQQTLRRVSVEENRRSSKATNAPLPAEGMSA